MKKIEENKYFIWLSSINEIEPIIKTKLIQKYKDPKEIFSKSEQELQNEIKESEYNISIKTKQKIINNLIDETKKRRIETYIEKMVKSDIGIITCNDKEYPESLKNIYDFPICIYFKGNMNILNSRKKIAIIRLQRI